jgi:hypothetical protein
VGTSRPPTVYTITNPNSTPLNVEQIFTSTTGRTYVYWSSVPPHGKVVVNLRDVKVVPNGFQGKVLLYANQPFTATVSGSVTK